MEGSYSKVWNAREDAPAAEYAFFVDSLVGTIRFARIRLIWVNKHTLLIFILQKRDREL